MKNLICLGLLLMFLSCKKRPETCNLSHFTFEHPVTVYPVKDSYNIGDTIWFEMNFSDIFNVKVRNNIYGNYRTESVQLKNFDFHRNFLSIFKMSDSTKNAAGQTTGKFDESFNTILEKGEILNSLPDGPEYKLEYSNNQYKLKIGLITKTPGLFLLSPIFFNKYPNAHNSLNKVEIRPECDLEYIEDIMFLINKQNDGSFRTNYDLFKKFMNPLVSYDINNIRNECYTFVVK
jgi:hypothetical protein